MSKARDTLKALELEEAGLDFITVKDADSDHVSSLLVRKPGVLRVVGVLQHGQNITFDKQNAQKLISVLKKIK